MSFEIPSWEFYYTKAIVTNIQGFPKTTTFKMEPLSKIRKDALVTEFSTFFN